MLGHQENKIAMSTFFPSIFFIPSADSDHAIINKL